MDSLSLEMQRFLISTVFGYDMNSEDENDVRLKNSCFDRAYLDLARVIPYYFSTGYCDEHKNSVDVKNFVDKKLKFKDDVKDYIFDEKPIKPIELIQNVYDYANNQEKLFDPKKKFSFGMAQKWVNMYNKYMWLFGKKDDIDLEMPIDSYIIDALYDNKIISLELCIDKNLCNKTWNGIVKGKKRASDYIKPWSQWDEKQYSAIQEVIRKSVSNDSTILKWENELWVSQSFVHKLL